MTRKSIYLLMLLSAELLSAGELPLPVFETTFRTNETGGILDNSPPPFSGN